MTLAMTTGLLLRAVALDETRVRLEEVTPTSRKPLKTIPRSELTKHVEDWSKDHGLTDA